MKLDEIAKKQLLLREDTRPSEGIWYFVFVKGVWQLEFYKATEYGDITHDEVWRKYICMLLADNYKINPDERLTVDAVPSHVKKIEPGKTDWTDTVRNSYRGMPRGRVTLIDGIYVCYHGNDSPLPGNKAETLVPAKFELTKLIFMKKVKWEFDDHETMLPTDRAIVEKAIGKMPL